MKKTIRRLSVWCCMAVLAAMPVHAADLAAVKNAYTDADSIVLFVGAEEGEINHAYVGNDEASFRREETGPVRTVVVLDNSLSIRAEYRESIKTFLADLAASGKDNDTFTIATFAEDVTYLVQESDDYLDIKTQVEGLQFVNQDSYFTNTIYTVLDDIETCEEIKYTRIIVIADGIDNEKLGYTDGELDSRIKKAGFPVYSVGCASNGNEENLKRMFALSRLSGGKSYLLGDVSGQEILRDIVKDTDVMKIRIIPSDKACDGTTKVVRLSIGDDYCQTEVSMPFKTVEETTEEVEPETTAAPEPEIEETQSRGMMKWAIPVAAAVFLAAVAAAMMVTRQKRKKKTEETFNDLSGIGHSKETVIKKTGRRESDTELLNGDTEIMGQGQALKLVLKDMDRPAKTFEYPLRDKVRIGRDASRCQIVIDYSKYVSSIHCEIVVKGNGLCVRDGGGDVIASTNGTFVNGKRVAPELPLPSGAVLKLGEVRLAVTYQ